MAEAIYKGVVKDNRVFLQKGVNLPDGLEVEVIPVVCLGLGNADMKNSVSEHKANEMAFLNTDQTRWGRPRGQLSPPFNERFRQIIDILHVDYFYERVLPANIEAEYQRWRAIVLQFINDLEDAFSD